MKHLRKIGLVALGLLLACDPLEPSDERQYWLRVGLVDQLGVDSHRVLVGSQFELYVAGVIPEGEIDPDGGGLLCAAASASGSLVPIDGQEFPTYRVESPGPGAVELAAPSVACPANEDVLAELGPDRWTMMGVEPSAATGRWVGAGDNAALFWNTSAGPAGSFPDVLGRPLDEARVAVGGRFSLIPVLVDQSAGERAEIRWHDPDAFVTVPGHYQELATYVDINGDRQTQQHLDGSLRTGESFDASVTILANELELPTVTAVPTQQITSLELVPVYFPSVEPEREWGLPAGVVALTRDGEGRRILGAPIEWSVTRGRVAAASQSYGDDVLELADCRDQPKQPQWRSATVEAKLDDLLAVVEIEWVALPTDELDPTSELCTGSACDCSTAASPRDSALASLALLVLGPLLRRRHSSRRRAASTEPT